MREIWKKAWNGVSTVLVALIVVLAVLLVGVRLTGLQVYTVLSGSMEPVYPTGALLYVKAMDPSELQVGDPATFVMNEDLMVATHRVIEIDEEKECFYTKGDANEVPDANPVLYENFLGRPVFCIPYLGYLAMYIQNPPGTYVAAAFAIGTLLLLFIPDLFSGRKHPGKNSM